MIRFKICINLLLFAAILLTFYAVYKRQTWKHDLRTADKMEMQLSTILKDETNFELKNLYDFITNNNRLYHKAININFVQKMYNIELFGQHSKDAAIIVVQVHDKPDYFQELVNSLKSIKNIEEVTLIISMDKFSSDIDKIVSSITFCRYMSIFFPFAKQLFQNSFPGEDINDCPRDISKNDAILKKCNNANSPDIYGHYREVKYVQTKHHWMWKLHMVFRGINVLRKSVGPVILLEEDYFVLPDLVHCAKKAVELRNSKCSKCALISLGNYKSTQNNAVSDQVEIHSWVSSTSNMGIVLTQSTYDILKEISDFICEYDDYNWDWSLQAILTQKFPEKIYTMQFKSSRVYHLGDCLGMHAKKKCDLQSYLQQIKAKTNNLKLFPDQLYIAVDHPTIHPLPKRNGGWGDLRDHALCKSYKQLYSH